MLSDLHTGTYIVALDPSHRLWDCAVKYSQGVDCPASPLVLHSRPQQSIHDLTITGETIPARANNGHVELMISLTRDNSHNGGFLLSSSLLYNKARIDIRGSSYCPPHSVCYYHNHRERKTERKRVLSSSVFCLQGEKTPVEWSLPAI
jgi:hypothetical protein